MKKKGSFLGGLLVFVLILVILGGVGYLGFNIIKNANGMSSMNMASDSKSKDSNSKETASAETSSETASKKSDTPSDAESAYKTSQINQLMINKQALDKAYETISSAFDKMTLNPYAPKTDTSSSMSDQSKSESKSDASTDTQANTTVNIYTDSATNQQSTQMKSMGQTYDADKMQQLHSGLYKVSVGMQLLKQLQDDIATQIEQASVDTSSETQYYINQYNTMIKNKNNINNALTYINEAVDLININPYVDANGLAYDSERMTQLHDSIYQIAQGVVDLNKLNNNLLSQSVDLGKLAQSAYSKTQPANQNSTDTTMNMTTNTTSFPNFSTIINVVLILFVVIFIIGLLGSIISLFKSGNQGNTTNDSIG